VLPQVLAGLGIVSLLSASCLLWLERLQPAFVVIALGGIGWQSWLVFRRPASMRTVKILAIWGCSVAVVVSVFAAWVALTLRYR
jgi:hypothetical protein